MCWANRIKTRGKSLIQSNSSATLLILVHSTTARRWRGVAVGVRKGSLRQKLSLMNIGNFAYQAEMFPSKLGKKNVRNVIWPLVMKTRILNKLIWIYIVPFD